MQTETVDQYHSRMQKIGFDISACNCKDCRLGKPISQEVILNNASKWHAKSYMPIVWLMLFLSLIVGIYFIYIIFKGLDECDACMA